MHGPANHHGPGLDCRPLGNRRTHRRGAPAAPAGPKGAAQCKYFVLTPFQVEDGAIGIHAPHIGIDRKRERDHRHRVAPISGHLENFTEFVSKTRK